MNNSENQNNLIPSVEDMQKEIRSLKRRLALAEGNLTRARLISVTQERTETILNASIKKELQFFKLVLENTNNILLLFDFDGRFAYASQTFLAEVGIANFGLISGRHFGDVLKSLISEESLKKFSDAVERAAIQKGTVFLEEHIDFGFKGLSSTFSISITPMTDDDGESTGIMALFNDITEINNALETANRASSAKSDFLANMSHEIRTPLNAIIGMSNIARNNSDMKRIHYCLDKVNDSSKHLLGVINDILDMSKIESNHFEISFSEFVFEKMLLRIIDAIRFGIEEKNITFSLHCDPSIPYAIFSDEQRLAQVIMNLLSNAVKFTPENGSISIHVEVESFDGNDYTLIFSVKDSGIGISEAQKSHLFKAFSQADGSISRKFGGTGLGLVISKNIINMLGGDIWFESLEGVGTTFIFNMKARSCRLKPDARVNLGNVRILAVDNTPDVLLSFSQYSDKLGIPCTTAENADLALDILKKEPHNIIFVDWKMLGANGPSFVKQLGGFKDGKVVVIIIPMADWVDIEKETKEAGVSDFVSKPILLPVIENVLDKYCEDLSRKEAKVFDDFTGKTILLVDDIEINREIIISVLEPTGINIVCAENGREAVEEFMANSKAFDFIFMDVQMPEMDGYDATRRIRALEGEAVRRVPIVAMTANVFKEDIEKCIASGMNDHIGKPVDVEKIYAIIRKWTNNANIESK